MPLKAQCHEYMQYRKGGEGAEWERKKGNQVMRAQNVIES